MLMALSALGAGPSPLNPSTAQQFPAQTLAVQPPGGVPININPNGQASPYAYSTNIVGLSAVDGSVVVHGTVEKVSLTLNGFYHNYPNDVQVLLVGPNGHAVVLMANEGAGQSIPANGALTLTFDDYGTAPGSTVAFANGGYYAPPSSAAVVNSLGNPVVPFPAPAPQSAGSYYTSLAAAFYGCPIAGTWSLYVVDDNVGSSGQIASWTLNVWQAPSVVSTTADSSGVTATENGQFVNGNTASFTVVVTDPTANAIPILTAYATCNPSSLATIALTSASADNTHQTLTVTPSNDQNTSGGLGTITVFVTDGSGAAAVQYSKTISLTVTPVNQPPYFNPNKITKQSDGSTVTGVTVVQSAAGAISVPLQITVADYDNTASQLTVQVTTSDNPEIVTPANVSFDSTTAATRNFTIVPNGTAVGTANLVLTVYDPGAANRPANQVNSIPLTVTVNAAPALSPPMFAAPAFGLAAAGTTVSSPLAGVSSLTVSKLTVTLNGVVGVDPATLGIQLVSPGGTTANLIKPGDVSGTGPFNFAQITFSDSASPVTSSSLGASSIVNVPLQPDDLSATKFFGQSASGTWTLKVTGGGANAQIQGGWVLAIYAAPTITSPGNIIVDQDTALVTIPFTVGSIDGTFSSSTLPVLNGLNSGPNANLATLNTSKTTWNPSTGQGSFQVAGNPGQWGTNALTVSITDQGGLTGYSASFQLGFEFVNHAPSIDFIPKQVTTAGAATQPFRFKVYDNDKDPALGTPGIGAPQNLTVTASSGDTTGTILPNENIILQKDPTDPLGRTWLMTLYPLKATALNAPVNVTITVLDNSTSDGPPANSTPLTASQTFPLVVSPPSVSLFTQTPESIELTTPQGKATPPSPYPSTYTIPANTLYGTLSDVKVNIFGISHYTPQDITLLLVHTDTTTSPATTRAALLMQGAGGAFPLSDAALTFSDSAPSALPLGAQITTGAYKPTAYGTPVSFPPVVSGGSAPPASGYGTTLDGTFAGMNPNGVWQLYAYEAGSATDKGGEIDGGWQLLITTAPNIQTIGAQSIPESSGFQYVPTPITIIVGDTDSSVAVSAVALNDTGGLIQEPIATQPAPGNGQNGSTVNYWQLLITPTSFKSGGPVTIQVNAVNGSGASSSSTFQLTVTPQTFAPIILSGAIAATYTEPAGTPLQFTFKAYDQPNPGSITINNISASTPSGTMVLPAGSVTVVPGTPNASDYSTPFTVTVTPVTVTPGPLAYGSSTITFNVTDTKNNKSTAVSFVANFTQQAEAWANPNALTIPQGLPVDGEAFFTTATALGYPTPIFVGPTASSPNTPSVPGLVGSVGVTVSGYSHGYPSDVDILLVHTSLNPPPNTPATKAVLLMSHAGGATPVNNLVLTFTNAQPGVPPIPSGPITATGPNSSGTFSPAQYTFEPAFPGLPSGVSAPFTTDLTTLDGMDPNGEWDLYVLDDTFPTGGSINNGWFLVLETGPAVTWANGNATSVNEGTTGHWPFLLSDQTIDPKNLHVAVNVISDAYIVNTDNSHTTIPVLTGAGASLTTTALTDVGGVANGNLVIQMATGLPSELVSATQVIQPGYVQLTVTDQQNNLVATSPKLAVTPVYVNQPTAITVNSLPLNSNAPHNPMLTVNENTATSLSFTIQDVDSVDQYANVTVTSENTAIVPNLDMTKATVTGFSGSPATLAQNTPATLVVPLKGVANAYNVNFDGSGTAANYPAILDIRVNDGNGNTSDQQVEVYVTHVEQPPTLSVNLTPPNGSTTPVIALAAGGQQTFTVTLNSVESAVTAITATPSVSGSGASYVSVVPLSPANGKVAPGGQVTFQVASLQGQAATAYITFNLNDNSGQSTGTASYPNAVEVVVAQAPGIASGNPAAISVNVGTATPPVGANSAEYPSPITINDTWPGGIYDVSVVVQGFTASDPKNVDLLLVYNNNQPSPNNLTKKVLLMSGSGGSSGVANLQLAFDSLTGTTPIPSPLVAGTYKPADSSSTDVLPSAPGRPYETSLGTFTGVIPAGTWSLYVADQGSGDTVTLPYGWTLVISTLPTLTPPSGLTASGITLPETTSAPNAQTTTLTFVAAEDQTQPQDVTALQASVTTAKGANSPVKVSVPASPSANGNLALSITPVLLGAGNDTITVVVKRPSDGAQAVYNLPITITAANVPPTISRIPNVSIVPPATSGQVEFVVSDPDSPAANITITATVTGSSPSGLLANSGLKFASGNNSIVANSSIAVPGANAWEPTLTITPAANISGTAQVTINVADAGSSEGGPATAASPMTFNVTVSPAPVKPAFSGVPANVPIQVGNSSNVTVTVTSANGAITGLTAQNSGSPISSSTTSQGSGNTWVVAIGTTLPAGQTYATYTLQSGLITLTATDASGAQNTATIPVTIAPRRDKTFTNPADINIVDNAPSVGGYPSLINVPSGSFNAVTKISSVTVTLNQFGHQYPSDVGVLLVSPNGTPIVLMENASRGSVSGLNLSFSAGAENSQGQPNYVPEITSLQPGSATSVTYVPANYNPNYVFPAASANPAPPASSGYVGIPYPDLTKLAGQTPEGNWYLYVIDEVSQDVGNIPGGWSLDITTAPQITFANATVNNGTAPNTTQGAVNTFTMNDDSQVPLTAVTPYYNFTVSSSDATIVPWNTSSINIVDSGDHVNFTVTVTPQAGKTSSSGVTINITGTDPDGIGFSGSFVAKFNAYNSGPIVNVSGLPANNAALPITAGTVAEVSFTYQDDQSPASPLSVSAAVTSGNAANVLLGLNYANGSGTLQMAPQVDGNYTITLTVTETQNEGLGAKSTAVQIPITVSSSAALNANANVNTISIPLIGPATPDPSVLPVAGVNGTITKATVVLDGFTHPNPSDVSVLLVGPNGQGVVLMSDAGIGAVNNVFLTFDDSAPSELPQTGQILGGSYQPSAYMNNPGPNFAQPGANPAVSPPPPPGPYQATLASAFNGISPDGNWYLYVEDEVSRGSGSIASGWTLNLQTTLLGISSIGYQQINENATTPLTVSFTVGSPGLPSGDNIQVSAQVTGSTPQGLITLGTPATTDDRHFTLQIAPVANMPSTQQTGNGTASVTITATDISQSPNLVNTVTFPVTVVWQPVAPVISGLPSTTLTIPANQSASGTFTASTTDAGPVVFSASVSQKGDPIGTVALAPNAVNPWTWQFTPTGNGAIGQTKVAVTVYYSTTSTTATFTIATTAGVAPTIIGLTNELIVLENTVGKAFFNASNLSLASVTNFIATNDNPKLIAGVQVSSTATGYEADVSLVPYQNNQTAGPANVYLAVVDQFGTPNVVVLPVTVIPVAYPPAIAPISDQYVEVGTPSVRVPFTVTDPAVPVSSLTYTGWVSNPGLVSGPITFASSGSSTYTATINLAANQAGASTVTFQASDGQNTAAQAFALVVTNPPPVAIAPIGNTNTTAGSSVTVPFVVTSAVTPVGQLKFSYELSNSNLVSAVAINTERFPVNGANATAQIFTVNNQFGSCLVTIYVTDGFSTAQQSFAVNVPELPPVFSAIGDTNTAAGSQITVPLDVTPTSVPISGLTFSYKLSNSNLVSAVAINAVRFPVTGGPTATAQIFTANNQSGTCVITIYVTDGVNTVQQSFALTVPETPPVFGAIADTNAPVNTPSVVVPLNVTPTVVPMSGLTFGYKLSNSNLVSSVLINTVRFPVNGATATAQIFPVSNQVGSCTITIYVSDGVNTVVQTFNFTVTSPVGPTLGAIADQTTPKNTPISVALVVTDPVTPLANLQFSTRSSNAKLVQSAIVVNNGTNATLAINLVTNAYGAAVITVSVTDTFTTSSQSFALLVLPTPPSLAPITSPVNAIVGSPVNVTLNVSSPDTALSQLTFAGSSTNTTLVSGVSFSTSGTNVTATVNLVPNATGVATVQIEVSDGYSTSAQSFALNVVPAVGPKLGATLSGKVLKITFTGVPNASYIIQGSSDLKTWTQVGTITTDANGKGEYDATVSGSGDQYFRALFQ